MRSSRVSARRGPHRRGGRPYLSFFFRAIGLESLNSLWARFKGYTAEPEPKKKVQQKSFWVALQRCGVHLLPSTISLVLITLNLKGYFIRSELAGRPGQTSQDMALLQIVAKIQELLMVASLTAVVVHRVRHDLISGEGVPFGLVAVGSLFNQLSFFWSPGFLGPISSKAKLNATLVTLVLICGLLAVTAGPAVAVLLLPRERTWPAGGSAYWINGTANDLWPSEVGLEHYMPELGTVSTSKASCTSANAYTNALCPAGGYSAILNHLSSTWPTWNEWPAHSGNGILIESPQGQMWRYTLVPAVRGNIALDTAAFAAYGPTAWVASRLGADWYDATISTLKDGSAVSRYRFYSAMQSTIKTQVPAVRVVCGDPVILKRGEREVAFPWIPEFDFASHLLPDGLWQNAQPRQLHTVTFIDGSLDNQTFTRYPRIFSVDLSNLTNTVATTGIIFESPWSDKESRKVSGCVVDARWAQGSVFVEYGKPAQASMDSIPKKFSFNDPYLFNDVFFPKSGSWRRINVTHDWFQAVNFPLPSKIRDQNLSNATSIEALIMGLNLPLNDSFQIAGVEYAITTYFADALARVGSWRILNVTSPMRNNTITPIHYNRLNNFETKILRGKESFQRPKVSNESFTEFQMKQTIRGYTYLASATTDFLALAVLFLHLLIALGHTVLILVTKRSSGCWDTLPELLAVAQQLSPSKIALHNTAVGIYKLATFRQRARLRVSEIDAEHVELQFDTDSHPDNLPKIDVFQEYK